MPYTLHRRLLIAVRLYIVKTVSLPRGLAQAAERAVMFTARSLASELTTEQKQQLVDEKQFPAHWTKALLSEVTQRPLPEAAEPGDGGPRGSKHLSSRAFDKFCASRLEALKAARDRVKGQVQECQQYQVHFALRGRIKEELTRVKAQPQKGVLSTSRSL